MKNRIIALIVVLAALLPFAVSCGSGDAAPSGATPITINVTVLSGTTGMGMAKLITDATAGDTAQSYNFDIVSDATAISAAIIGGTADIAAAPTNLAPVLYNKTQGGIYILAVNTLGVLYILENGEEIKSINDLKGKTVYLPGKGTNPEFILQYIIEQNGMTVGTDVVFDYSYSTPDTLATAVSSGLAGIALLPEPKATVARNALTTVRTALDITAEWEKVAPENSLVQGCLIVRKEFADGHREELLRFLEEYAASVSYITGEDTDAAAATIASAKILPKAALAKQALPFCNITYIDGVAMKASLSEFYRILHSVNPASVGGEIPVDGIYYIK